MPASKRTAASGNRNTFMGFMDEFGFMTGSTPTAPSAGAMSFMIPVLGIKSASPAIPEPDSEGVTGDDDLIAEFDYPSLTGRRFTADTAVQDLDAEAAILGTTVETVAGMYMSAEDIKDAPERNMCGIFQSRAKKLDSGVSGQKAWNGKFIPLMTAMPLGRRAFEERAAAAFAYSFTPQPAGYAPWGYTIQVGGFLNANTARSIALSTEYPAIAVAFTGDGVTTEWTWLASVFAGSPVSVSRILVTVDRVAVAVSAVGTRSFTIAAPRDGGRGVAIFQYQ